MDQVAGCDILCPARKQTSKQRLCFLKEAAAISQWDTDNVSTLFYSVFESFEYNAA